MGVRMTEGVIAALAGAGDALVTSKVSIHLPGGVPPAVAYEGLLIVGGLFGDKVGISREHADAALIAGLTLGGARVTRVALAGKLMSGPAAWGGAGGDPTYALSAGSSGGDQLAAGGAGARSVRLLAGRRAGVGGASIYPAMSEAPGVAG